MSEQSSSAEKFDGVTYGSLKGSLTLTSNEIVFLSTSKKETKIPTDKIIDFELRFATRGYLFRVHQSKKTFYEFGGLKKPDVDRLKTVLSQMYESLKVRETDVCLKGYNWGDIGFNEEENHLKFSFESTDLFDVPLEYVRNCVKHPKTKELVLEFSEDASSGATQNDDCLVEMRFALPKDAEDEKNTVDEIHKAITKRADIVSDAAQAIATFTSLPFVTPRGRYSVDLFSKFMRLHGKTHDFKIPYNSISSMFLLPKPDQQHMYFVISLDAPVRIGKTSHFHLVFQFDKADSFTKEAPLKLSIKKEEIESQFSDKTITEKMTGKVFEVVAKVFRALTARKLIGSGSFTSAAGEKGLKCSLKASEGFLFFLEKSIFFLHKPPTYVRHEEIKTFKPQRVDGAGGSRSFDLVVVLKNGKSHTFSNIAKSEHDNLIEFLKKKGLPLEIPKASKQQEKIQQQIQAMDDDDSEEDEDFVAGEDDGSDDDEDFNDNVEGAEVIEEAPKKASGKENEKKRPRAAAQAAAKASKAEAAKAAKKQKTSK